MTIGTHVERKRVDSHLFGYIHSLNLVSSEHVIFQSQNISVHLLRDD